MNSFYCGDLQGRIRTVWMFHAESKTRLHFGEAFCSQIPMRDCLPPDQHGAALGPGCWASCKCTFFDQTYLLTACCLEFCMKYVYQCRRDIMFSFHVKVIQTFCWFFRRRRWHWTASLASSLDMSPRKSLPLQESARNRPLSTSGKKDLFYGFQTKEKFIYQKKALELSIRNVTLRCSISALIPLRKILSTR